MNSQSLCDEPMVYDIGSGNMKIGWGGDDAPRDIIPMITAKGRDNSFYIGDEALSRRGQNLDILHPIRTDGGPVDWDSLMKILHYSFEDGLRISQQNHGILFPSLHRMTDRAFKNFGVVFEKFDLPGFCITDPLMLSLYASGRTTGMVMESGNGITRTSCIYEAYPIQHTYFNLEKSFSRNERVSGSLITDYLGELLSRRININLSEVLEDIKIKSCFVAEDYEREIRTFTHHKELNYSLPDGENIVTRTERFQAPEILFNPSMVSEEYEGVPGIPELIRKSIEKCDVGLRKEMLQNIILSGGSTMFPGFSGRVKLEVEKLFPDERRVKIVAPMERKFSVWIGGSIMVSLSTMEKEWMTKAMYEEMGKWRCLKHFFGRTKWEKEGVWDMMKKVDTDEEERRMFSINLKKGVRKKKEIVLRNVSVVMCSLHLLILIL